MDGDSRAAAEGEILARPRQARLPDQLRALSNEHIRVKLLEGAYDHVPGEPKPPAKPVQASQVSNERWRERVKIWLTTGKAALDA